MAGRTSERARPDDLRRAVGLYLETYQRSSRCERVARDQRGGLLKRAEADAVAIDNAPALKRLAEEILGRIEQRYADGRADAWDKATAMEANLALDRPGDALTWLIRYVNGIAAEHHGLERAEAFTFESTRRQLIQVWRLDRSREPGSLLIPASKAHCCVPVTAASPAIRPTSAPNSHQGPSRPGMASKRGIRCSGCERARRVLNGLHGSAAAIRT